jgi:hypothetical protein
MIDLAYRDYYARVMTVTLYDLTGFAIGKLDPEVEEHLKFKVASDLLTMYQRGEGVSNERN